ncbi:MAG: hypothetical protein KC414_06075, partial [Romboutsia sp.]|nr:hypothetical protein [Romboutsia sp.]
NSRYYQKIKWSYESIRRDVLGNMVLDDEYIQKYLVLIQGVGEVPKIKPMSKLKVESSVRIFQHVMAKEKIKYDNYASGSIFFKPENSTEVIKLENNSSVLSNGEISYRPIFIMTMTSLIVEHKNFYPEWEMVLTEI